MDKISKDKLALAVDNISEKAAIEELIKETSPYIGMYKIGFEQFIRFGPPIIDVVKKYNCKIFLDLKLHDIPNTVAKAVKAASKLNVDILTIHTIGGSKMLKAASEAAKECVNPPKLIGVTVLTSIDQASLNNDMMIPGSITNQVSHLAKLAVLCDLNGIVCSVTDLADTKKFLPETFEVVTPGIRLADSALDDQKRVATPQEAINNGATILVLGRIVTRAENVAAKAREILNLICS